MASTRHELLVEASLKDSGVVISLDRIRASLGSSEKAADGTAKAMDGLERETKQAGDVTKDATTRSKAFTQSMTEQGVAIRNAIIGYAAAAVGLHTLVSGFKDSINLSLEHQKVIASLQFAFRDYGKEAGNAAKRVDQWAEGLQRATGLSSEAIASGAALAANYGATEKQAKALTQAALDYAAATGRSVEEAIRQVTKTLGGYAGELGETVPELKALTTAQLQAGDAARVLNEKFGGAAETMGKTLPQSIEILKQSLRDVKQAAGDAVLGVSSGDVEGNAEDIRLWAAAWDELTAAIERAGSAGRSRISNLFGTGFEAARRVQQLRDAFSGPDKTPADFREVTGSAVTAGKYDPALGGFVKELTEAEKKLAEEIRAREANIELMLRQNVALGEATIAINRVAEVPDPRSTPLGPLDINLQQIDQAFVGPLQEVQASVDGLTDSMTKAAQIWQGATDPKVGFRPGDTESRTVIGGPFTPIDQNWNPVNQDDLRFAEQTMTGFFDSIGDGFLGAIFEGESFFDSLSDGFKNLLREIFGELTRAATQQIVRSLIPIPGLSTTGGGNQPNIEARTGAQAQPTSSTRWVVRNDLRREIQLATARGRF